MITVNIAWLQDLNIFTVSGGAQQTDRTMFNEGLARGHLIQLVTPEMYSKTFIETSDLVILSNVMMFPEEALNQAMEKPYVKYEHDFNFCRWRAYFPRLPKCLECPRRPFWKKIFWNSILNVFLSPKHYDLHKFWFPRLEKANNVLNPSPVSPDLFKKPENEDRKKNSVVYVGPLCDFKGTHNVLEFAKGHNELSFDFIGISRENFDNRVAMEGHKYYNPVPEMALPKIYQKYEYFIHLPKNVMPFERVVAEAFLSGCKLIVNENVGAMSYPWFTKRDKVAYNLWQSPNLFWLAIEHAMENGNEAKGETIPGGMADEC